MHMDQQMTKSLILLVASRNFDLLVGGSYPYINKINGHEATRFLFPITDKLILKSRIKWTY